MSKLINKTRLQKFATDFWAKIKGRYDETFKDATITEKTNREKKITFTKVNNTTKDVSLADYARLSDKNDFEKDVTSNIGMTDNTLKYGSINGNENRNRISGYRGVTSKSFVDGYIDHITVLADETQSEGDSTTWKIWAVKKGATRDADRVHKKYNKTATIKLITINGVEYKAVDLPINESFSEEVYFIVRCEGRAYKVVNLRQENQNDDVVNVSTEPGGEGSIINWEPVRNNIAVMFLVGRESIKSLSEKIRNTQADSSKYVLQSETTTTGGAGSANKVARLGGDGKLDKNMLPSIAINDYFPVTAFTDEQLRTLTYENGDVVFDRTTQKRYLCVDKEHNTTNLRNAFVELNDKSGVVTSVNDETGAVNLTIEATTEKLQLKVNDTMKSEVNIISEDEINTIIGNLQ